MAPRAHLERPLEGVLLDGCALSPQWLLVQRGKAARGRQHATVRKDAHRKDAHPSGELEVARAHSQKKALMCVCVSSARRTTATRLPEGSGSPGEFPEEWQ